MCSSLSENGDCESDLGKVMNNAMGRCSGLNDYCSLLPDTPASEVTKDLILKTIYDLEIIGKETSPPPLTYLKSLYWTVMTLLTVGYGDMGLPGSDDIQ